MSNLGSFVWGIADVLRGPYKPHEYGNVILPMTILRRIDCVLEETHEEVQKLVKKAEGAAEDLLAAMIQRKTHLPFYNTSPWTMHKLLGDPEGLEQNLVQYISGFSANLDVFQRFGFIQQIHRLAEKNLLFLVFQRFVAIDLSPSKVSNAEMGDLYEHLIRTFNESSNESPGEHFTPRDAIRLMVELIFAGDDEALSKPGTIRTIYDPTAGTGGMLSIAEEHLIGTPEHPGMNPQAQLNLYGQEWNDQSYAICKSDLLIKGQDASNIQLGDTLADDKFAGMTFDYCLSNPPYGTDWKASEAAVKDEIARLGEHSRFPAGHPAISDGQMLFLEHVVSKIRPASQGGGRAGIVMNGSPLFNGDAESGPSNIRKWLLESDLVDAIVALPTDMFYNTGISTYIWVLDNAKPAERRGTVQLINATEFYTKMRKKLGDKGRELSPENRAAILELYAEHTEGENSKILRVDEFGYWAVTVERPLLGENGEPILDKKGKPQPDKSIKAKDKIEKIPFTYGGNTDGDAGRKETVAAYMKAEVEPYLPGAWVVEKKTKIGYEISFTRHFYKYVPPRPLAEIDAELKRVSAEIVAMLQEVTE